MEVQQGSPTLVGKGRVSVSIPSMDGKRGRVSGTMPYTVQKEEFQRARHIFLHLPIQP